MRSILTLLAMAMLVVSIGCDSGAEAPAKKDADKPATTESSATTPTVDAEGMTTVSLKLPGMT